VTVVGATAVTGGAVVVGSAATVVTGAVTVVVGAVAALSVGDAAMVIVDDVDADASRLAAIGSPDPQAASNSISPLVPTTLRNRMRWTTPRPPQPKPSG
jgi:hypothetical protein